MKRTTCWIGLLCATVAAVGAGAGTARADGLPVLGVDAGLEGVVGLAGDARYVTLPAGKNTVVARVDPRGGRIVRSRLLPGTLTIPAVAYDGSSGGLSGDGRTLVLIRPRLSFPRATTTLVALDAKRLVPRSEVKLRGDFSYDALSPDGAWLYLIQYVSPTDPTRYAVRVYDLEVGRLLAQPVTDPNERGPMHGSPTTRVVSAGAERGPPHGHQPAGRGGRRHAHLPGEPGGPGCRAEDDGNRVAARALAPRGARRRRSSFARASPPPLATGHRAVVRRHLGRSTRRILARCRGSGKAVARAEQSVIG